MKPELLAARRVAKVHFKVTQYGFEWGPVIVTRVASDAGRWGFMVDVGSLKQTVAIRVTRSGIIRVGNPTKNQQRAAPSTYGKTKHES